MDEEGKKINLSNFFERSDSIDKKASTALSKSNSAISAISANKLLIESLQMSIETMQTQIRDIANYIIIENKLEKDEREDRLLEEQDAKQKQEMMDRALGVQGVKGDKGSKGQPGEFGQEGGGGSFLGGLIKALALGGTLIASVKLLGPVLLPLLTKGIFTKLIPALGKGISLGFGKLGGVIAKGLTGSLGKLPIVGKAIMGLGSKLISGIGSVGTKIVSAIAGAIGLSGLAGGSVKASESNMSFASGEEGGSDEGLVKGGKEGGSDEGLVKGGKEGEGIVESGKRALGGVADFMTGGIFDFDKKGGSASDNIAPSGFLFKGAKEAVKGVKERGIGGVIAGGVDALSGNLLDLDKKGGETFGMGRVYGGVLDAVTGNKFDFDRKNESVEADELTFKNIDQLKSSVSTNSAAIQTITNPAPQTVKNTNSPVTVQNSKPQVTYTQIKTTKPAIPFINTLGNQYLSLSPHTNKLPPEIARMIQ